MTDLDLLTPLAADLLARMERKGLMLVTAESCTGGLLAGLLTELPGSSSVFERGFVTYSNEAKTDLLGVPDVLIRTHGAVSREVAMAMAEGALAASRADVAVSITGVAGPGGGTPEKPVGTVHFGCAAKGLATSAALRHFTDNGRSSVRAAAMRAAIELVSNFTDNLKPSSSFVV